MRAGHCAHAEARAAHDSEVTSFDLVPSNRRKFRIDLQRFETDGRRSGARPSAHSDAMDSERFVLAIGDSLGEVVGWDDVEIVELRPTFVVVKTTNIAAAEIRRRCGRFVTLLDGERATRAVIDLFDHVPARIMD